MFIAGRSAPLERHALGGARYCNVPRRVGAEATTKIAGTLSHQYVGGARMLPTQTPQSSRQVCEGTDRPVSVALPTYTARLYRGLVGQQRATTGHWRFFPKADIHAVPSPACCR